MPNTYIIYSRRLKRFYTGSTRKTAEERLELHLVDHRGFTSKAKDWVIVYVQKCESIREAMILERKIKKRGASRFLLDLED